MARIESIARGGYYPIPPAVLTQIIPHIDAANGGRVYDPFAGEGAALAELACRLQLIPYGSELNEQRAATAATLLRKSAENGAFGSTAGRIFQSDARRMDITKWGFNLLYANPPFDTDAQNKRLELSLLKATRPVLMPRGLLVWIVPQHILAYKRVADYLASWYDNIRIFRFPDGLNRFKEAVVFATARGRSRQPDDETVAWIRHCGGCGDELTPLDAAGDFTYKLPRLTVPNSQFRFLPKKLPIVEVLAEAAAHGVMTLPVYKEHLQPPKQTTAFRPLTPLRHGHLVNIMAAGFLNNALLVHPESGERIFIKGLTYKSQRTEQHQEMDREREELTHVTTITDVFNTTITLLRPNGEVERIEGEQLPQFLKHWLEPLTQLITDRFQPAYQFNLNGYKPVLDTLNQKRTIPGTTMRGLAPAQQHAVAAAAMRLDERHLDQKDAVIVGEMGVGKTICGPAVASCIGAKRVLVLCPPHLTGKWEREIRHVVPDVRVMQLKRIRDVDDFFAADIEAGRVFGIMKETSARSASGWRHAYSWCGPVNQKWLKRGQKRDRLDIQLGSALLRALWDAKFDLSEDPNATLEIEIAGRTRVVKIAALLRYVAARSIPRCPTTGSPILINDRPIRPSDFRGRQLRESVSNSPLYSYTRSYRQGEQPLSLRNALHRQQLIQERIRSGLSPYGSSLSASADVIRRPQHIGRAKWPLASYIQLKYQGQIDLLIADEMHEYKGHDSDRGYAFARLVAASKKLLGLTGTIYGGKASTLFSLLYRISRRMKADYNVRDISRWVGEYGILQEVIKQRESTNGTQTGNRRTSSSTKELPGASPAMVSWLLDRSVFISLADMGFALPDYKEEPITLTMTPAMQEQYDSLEGQLISQIRAMLARGDRTLLAAYLQALLTWPDSPWRPKVVRHPHTDDIVAQIPGLDIPVGAAPKEQAILKDIQAELKQKRKVLLLCQQTDTLDITGDWVQFLARHDIRAAVLKVEPARREQWIAQQEAAGTQVIITHPRRIQTGLDILDYPAVIWMGNEFSVYTVKQANRRPYRIGQTEPVRVRFYAYEETLQAHALRLIAAKMAATERIDGNTIASDSLSEYDELLSGDLVSTLAKLLVDEEQQLQVDSLQDAFANANSEFTQSMRFIGVAAAEAANGALHTDDEAVPAASQSEPVLGPLAAIAATVMGNGAGNNSHGRHVLSATTSAQSSPRVSSASHPVTVETQSGNGASEHAAAATAVSAVESRAETGLPEQSAAVPEQLARPLLQAKLPTAARNGDNGSGSAGDRAAHAATRAAVHDNGSAAAATTADEARTIPEQALATATTTVRSTAVLQKKPAAAKQLSLFDLLAHPKSG